MTLAAGPVSADRPAPRYSAIGDALADAIAAGRLPPGAVLTEEPLSRLFGTSRTPVRTALADLESRGLLARFEGRGYVVAGGAEPLRLGLSRAMLDLPDPPSEPQPGSAERIARDFEGRVAGALPFGLYRVNEQAAADHYAVSRTVIRELLSRFQDRGLVRKDLRSHWVVGPLTARDVAHYFAIRGSLEPLALTDSAPRMPAAEIRAMHERLEAARDGEGPEAGPLAARHIAALEEDIHIRLLARSPNLHLLRMIHQSQIALTVNGVFASFAGVRPFAPALGEHAIVLEFLMRGAHDAAARALQEHLRLSAERTRQRLMAISVFPRPDLPAWLVPQKRQA